MTQYITRAVYNGTKQDYAITGSSVDNVMKRIRKMRELRNASLFLFYHRKTNRLVDTRFN